MVDDRNLTGAKRIPSRGKRKRAWGCYESLMLRLHAIFSLALTLLIFVGDIVQNPDLAAVVKAHGANYLTCWAVMNALAASALKYRDNTSKQA